MKSVSCVTQLSCVHPAINVQNAALNLPVGARLQNFWTVWSQMGVGPKVVQILKQGYTLPFQNRPKLSRFPTVISSYANLHRNSYLLEALQQLIDKNAVERVHNQTSLGFFNRLFLVPKPNNKWRPILDLSKLNHFLKTEKFRMETPETIRTSLRQGEWVTSVDFISNEVYPECAGYGNVPITQINWLMPIGWIAPIFHIHHFSLNFLCLESGLWYFREHHSSTENFMSLTEWPFSVKCLETGVILFSLGWLTECLCSYILFLNGLLVSPT